VEDTLCSYIDPSVVVVDARVPEVRVARRKRDHYQVLGVPKNADEKAIKQAYRKLARLYHPDVNGDDAEATARFREITEAYETLSDPKRRRSYDLFGAPEDRGALDDLGIESALSSLKSIFQRDKPVARPGADVETDLTVSLREAYAGATRDVKIVVDRPCATCAGTGKVQEDRCKACRGQGAKLTEDVLSVRVPAGVSDGARLRLRGRGPVGEHQGPPGDVYVLVKVSADARFDRDGDQLLVDAQVPASTALLGGTVQVELPDDTRVTMTVPACTQGGTVFRVREKGFAPFGQRASTRGDALVTVHIALPRKLSDEERALVEKMRASIPGF